MLALGQTAANDAQPLELGTEFDRPVGDGAVLGGTRTNFLPGSVPTATS